MYGLQVFLAQLSRRAELLNDEFQQWVVDTVLTQAVTPPNDPLGVGFEDLQGFDDLALGDETAESAAATDSAVAVEIAGTVTAQPFSRGLNVIEASTSPMPAVTQLVKPNARDEKSDIFLLNSSVYHPQSQAYQAPNPQAAVSVLGELCHSSPDRTLSGGEMRLEGTKLVTREQDSRRSGADNSSSAGTADAIYMVRLPSYRNAGGPKFQISPIAATLSHNSGKTCRRASSYLSSHSKVTMADFFGTSSVTSTARLPISATVAFKEGPGPMQVFPAPVKTLARMCEKVCSVAWHCLGINGLNGVLEEPNINGGLEEPNTLPQLSRHLPIMKAMKACEGILAVLSVGTFLIL